MAKILYLTITLAVLVTEVLSRDLPIRTPGASLVVCKSDHQTQGSCRFCAGELEIFHDGTTKFEYIYFFYFHSV